MAEPNGPPNGVLTSWKEIARFFNREVRTVQLWEKEEGLPVHRHLHRRQASVYAYPDELEQWWKQRSARAIAEGTEAEVALALPAAEASPAARAVAAKRSTGWVWAGVAAVAVALALWGIAGRAPQKADHLAPGLEATPVAAGSWKWGAFASSLSDLNGDGRDDFLFAEEPQYGEVYIHFSTETAIAWMHLPATASVVIRGSGQGYLSHSSADLNGDGIRDLILSEYLNEPYQYAGTGQTYIFWGRQQWPPSLQLTDADVTIRIATDNDARLGPCAVRPNQMDLNGDGLQDLFLGAHDYTEKERRSAGGLFVLWGRRHWPKEMELLASADVRVVGARTGEGLGSSCDVGDFNGDGRPDLAVYANEATLWEMRKKLGRSYLFFGRANWPRRIDATTDYDFRVDGRHSVGPGSLALADINGDSREDLLLLHSNAKPPGRGGEFMAWFGNPSRRGAVTEDDADLLIRTDWPQSDWGASLTTADLDDDGNADLLVAAPASGSVNLLYGRGEWKPRGELAEYSPVTVFSGKPGAGHAIAIQDADADLLPELFVWSALDSAAAGDARAWVVQAHRRVALEVRPLHGPNILYLPDGMLVARIKGESRGVAEALQLDSLRLAGAAPVEQVRADYNADGVMDVQLYFETATLRVTPETKRVLLTGRTREGLPAAATDSVQVVMKSAARDTPPAALPR